MPLWYNRKKSHHVGDAADGLGVQHDDLGGDMSLHGLRHVLHRAVDGGVFDLEPVVCVPADQEPHILLPVELLLEHLQQGGEGRGGEADMRGGWREGEKW